MLASFGPRSRLSNSLKLMALAGLATLIAPCHGLTLYEFGNPSPDEQHYIEYVNRARAKPAAEGLALATTTDAAVQIAYDASHFNVNLALMQSEFTALQNNEDPPVLPPLAPNACLATAARLHSAWMLANATQSHNEPTNTPSSRVAAAGYTAVRSAENIYASSISTWFGHAGFEVDWGSSADGMQVGRGHRANIHNPNYREIGLGVSLGTNGAAGPQVVTQDFATSAANPTLGTGVAYYDLNANAFYDPGEGIAGLTVNVSGADVTQYCLTAIGGGWVVPVPATAATRTVNFTGLNMNQTATLVIAANENAKADLRLTYAPPTITSAASAPSESSHTLTFSPVGGATRYTWNRWATITAATAENCNSTANITSTTTGTYSVLNSTVKSEGTAAFHLENCVAPGASQPLELRPLYYGQASPSLTFQSRIRYATTAEQFKVQIKEEGSPTWLDVFTQTGTNGAGESGFTPRTVALSAMAGKTFRVRFLMSYAFGGNYYFGSSGDSVGWFIDAITFTGVATPGNLVSQSLATTTGTFTPSAGTYLMSVVPVISDHDFPPSYQTFTATGGLPPAITTQPASLAINTGTSTTLTAAASGTSPTFQWYVGATGVTANPISGATGTAYSTPVLTATTSYWVRASNTAGSADSATATVTVTIITSPLITTQPASLAIKSNTSTTLSVVASGASLTYQWYRGISPSTSSKISGATTSSYTTPNYTTQKSYWVRVTNPYGVTNSNTATVSIAVAPAITSHPLSTTLNFGASATLTVAASGSPSTFQWYAGSSGVTTNPIPGATTSSFTTPALDSSTSYWVRATNAAGFASSNAAIVTVITPPAITTQPVSTTINFGNTATLTVAASGTSPAVQWYVGPSGVTTNPVPGATASSFTTPTLASSTSYWAKATNAAGFATSNAATVTVRIPFAAWAANLEAAHNLAPGTLANQPNGDYDHDGRANLIEYAFGTSPVVANEPTPHLPVATTTATHFILTYQRDTALTDITFTTQASTTLGDWKAPGESGAPAGFEDVVRSTTNNLETRQASIPRSSGSHQFLRVRITQP